PRAEKPAPASRSFAFFRDQDGGETSPPSAVRHRGPEGNMGDDHSAGAGARADARLAHCAPMFTPETLEVVMVSFEGPDQYSQAGGLGVRARELCRGFAAAGFRTTPAFVGDPEKPAEDDDQGVHLLRWCQVLSRRSPSGVDQG